MYTWNCKNFGIGQNNSEADLRSVINFGFLCFNTHWHFSWYVTMFRLCSAPLFHQLSLEQGIPRWTAPPKVSPIFSQMSSSGSFSFAFFEGLGWLRCSSMGVCEALCNIACTNLEYTNTIWLDLNAIKMYACKMYFTECHWIKPPLSNMQYNTTWYSVAYLPFSKLKGIMVVPTFLAVMSFPSQTAASYKKQVLLRRACMLTSGTRPPMQRD